MTLLTDSVHSPMTLYSSCNLIARSDMASIIRFTGGTFECDQCTGRALHEEAEEGYYNTETLEQIWDEYQVYSKDELNMVGDRVELSGNENGKPEKDNGR